MEIINSTKAIQWSKMAADIQVTMSRTSEVIWSSDFFQATVISSLFLVAYWSIIYLDSSQPGVNPPSPFSTVIRKRIRHQRQAHIHLNYLCGALIAFLLFLSILFRIF